MSGYLLFKETFIPFLNSSDYIIRWVPFCKKARLLYGIQESSLQRICYTSQFRQIFGESMHVGTARAAIKADIKCDTLVIRCWYTHIFGRVFSGFLSRGVWVQDRCQHTRLFTSLEVLDGLGLVRVIGPALNTLELTKNHSLLLYRSSFESHETSSSFESQRDA